MGPTKRQDCCDFRYNGYSVSSRHDGPSGATQSGEIMAESQLMHVDRWKRWITLGLLAGVLLGSPGCGLFFKRVKVKRLLQLPMKTATVEQLVNIFNHEASGIQTMNAKVDLVASTGGVRTGTVTQYRDIVAYLLVRKPSDIRLVGQFSLIGTLFDMASDGTHFQLNLPTRGQFIVGQNNVIPEHTKNPLEKLRPQVILQALLINPIGNSEKVAAMNDNAETSAEYTLLVLHPGTDGVIHLERKIIFSRYDLLPRRQIIYDDNGFVATQASYGQYFDVQGVQMPTDVVIERPEEEYSLRLTMKKVTLNQPLGSEKFRLVQPPNTKLVRLSKNGTLPIARAAKN